MVFDETFSTETVETISDSRRIIIIFVREIGNLDLVIPTGSYVYLGGDHGSENLGMVRERSCANDLETCKYY